MNESILNILNSTYYIMSNKLIPLPRFPSVWLYINYWTLFHETKPNLSSNISTNWPLKGCFANTCLKRTATKFFMFGLSFHRCGLRAIQNNHCFGSTFIAVDFKIIMFFSNSGFFLKNLSAKVNITLKLFQTL